MSIEAINPTERKPYDPAAEWLSVAEAMDAFQEDTIQPTSLFPYSNAGIERVPVSNKQWIEYTGTETKPRAGLVWLKQGQHYKAKDGLIHRMLIKHYSGYEWRIIWGMVRNTLLCKKLAGIDIRMEAIDGSVSYYLRENTDCPLDILDSVSNAVAFTAKILIDTYSDKDASEIQRLNGKYITSRGATDYASRKALWTMLKTHGIERLTTRKQQETLIDKVLKLPKFSHIKENAKRSILKKMWEEGILKPSRLTKTEKSAEIMQKQAVGIPLTAAARQFKARNKDLF